MTQKKYSEHFSAAEFRCRCGACVPVEPPEELINGLERLREICGGRPVIITSGHRCAKHNAAVGGVSNSKHLTARAADVVIRGVTPQEITTLIKYLIPSLRALPYKDYTHIDLRGI